MSQVGKDSALVVEFMTLFAKLRHWTDDEPQGIIELAGSDASIKKLCLELFDAAYFLKMNERRSRRLFAAPVDPSFISAWRDYEERYESVVANVWLLDLELGLGGEEPGPTPKAELQWANADRQAVQQASGIEDAIDFAQFNIDDEERWADQPDFADRIADGIAAWDRLKKETGFDLRGMFRRRALIPFVLVPRWVAAKHGDTEKPSLLKNLQEAHDAFVFGGNYAALALMRSIMEAVLREHFRAEGKNLSELINNAGDRLPRAANKAALHRLRKLANAILHLDERAEDKVPKMDEMWLEKEVTSFLFVLRALIEKTK